MGQNVERQLFRNLISGLFYAVSRICFSREIQRIVFSQPLTPIHDFREFYANFVVAVGGSSDANLISAFLAVRREDYLGKGPWPIVAGRRYLITDDPRALYHDVVVGLVPKKQLNNGKPSLHACCMAACAPVAGNAVVHIGAGTGYYTAILATLVGPAGKVIGYEIEQDLAEKARENVRHFTNIRIENASATEGALPGADVIYVSAGATHPPGSWLDALNVGGRLLFPLTQDNGRGVMLLVTRRKPDAYAARVVCGALFIRCVGAQDKTASEKLGAAFKRQTVMAIKSLRRGATPDATAWCAGDGWWLSTAEPP